jgi:hypothetical protein
MMAAPAGRRRRSTAVVASACIACYGVACYSYVPIGGNGVSPGNQIAVDLTTEGSAALAQLIGPAVTTIDGRLISSDSTGITLAVTDTRLRDGRSYHWVGERVLIPRLDILSIEIRRLSVTQTGLLVAVGALGVGGVIAVASHTGAGATQRNGGHPPPR